MPNQPAKELILRVSKSSYGDSKFNAYRQKKGQKSELCHLCLHPQATRLRGMRAITDRETVLFQPWPFAIECAVVELENLANGESFARSSAPYSDSSPSEIKRLVTLLLQENIPHLLKTRLQAVSDATGRLVPLWGESCAVRFRHQSLMTSVPMMDFRQIGNTEADRRQYPAGSQKRFWFLSGFLAPL